MSIPIVWSDLHQSLRIDVDLATSIAGNLSVTGQSQTVNHEPPYYEIADLMRG